MENEPCSICLEQLFQTATAQVTRLQPCGHYYHPDCIKLWRERSNHCPTCRADYVFLESVTQQGTVVASEVADFVELPPTEEEFFEGPAEDEDLTMIDAGDYAVLERRIQQHVAYSNRCTLCDTTGGSVLACSSCSSTFHGQCLGLGNSRIAQWFCPMCSAEQGAYTPPSVFRRSRFSQRTNRVYNTLMASTRVRDLPIAGPAMSEFVVERPQISPEEQIAWDSFEMARQEAEAGSSSMMATNSVRDMTQEQPTTSRKQKLPSRRKRTTQTNAVTTTNPTEIPKPKGPSLINTLLTQMKEHKAERMHPPPLVEPVPMVPHYQGAASMSSGASSPHSVPTSPETPSSPIDKTNRSVWKMSTDSSVLSFEQKQTLQEIVRAKLRPLYKDGGLDEDQYTQINKKVSRILYDAYSKDENMLPDFEGLAEFHVHDEVSRL